jgi:hypothetical protein
MSGSFGKVEDLSAGEGAPEACALPASRDRSVLRRGYKLAGFTGKILPFSARPILPVLLVIIGIDVAELPI